MSESAARSSAVPRLLPGSSVASFKRNWHSTSTVSITMVSYFALFFFNQV